MTELTLGSLFDGIGGFPLAAVRNGIRPLWASEIERALLIRRLTPLECERLQGFPDGWTEISGIRPDTVPWATVWLFRAWNLL